MTDDEENALRYVAGYVIRSVLEKVNKMPSSNLQKSVMTSCLLNLSAEEDLKDGGPSKSDYYSCTKLWLERINRGGLYVVSDDVYLVFKAMEIVTRKCLASILDPSKGNIEKEKTLTLLCSDDDVTAQTDEDTAQTVLKRISTLFLTIRGFAMVAMFMEDYKRMKQGSKALRSDLKRKSMPQHICDNSDIQVVRKKNKNPKTKS